MNRNNDSLTRRSVVSAISLAVTLAAAGCGGDDGSNVAGSWTHPEEGTIVLDADHTGTITQSSDPVEFEWALDGATVGFDLDGDPATEPDAFATLSGDQLTFRVGDFSGNEPATFTRR